MRAKGGFDWSVTGRSNWGSTFVFNKTLTPGWGEDMGTDRADP